MSIKSLLGRMENRIFLIIHCIRPPALSLCLKHCLRIPRKYIKTDQGYMFWVDPLSTFGLEILRSGVYEPQMTYLLRLVLRLGDVFIDIGANEGYFSIIASALVANGQVYCIEPQSRLQQVILENVKINNAHTVKIHQVALSDNNSGVELFLSSSIDSGFSSIHVAPKLCFRKEKVPSLPLDNFFEINKLGRVRLIKIDTEGAEHDIVTGGIKSIQRGAFDFIALEYHLGIFIPERITSTHKILKDSGYILTKCGGQTIYHLPGLDKEIQSLGDLQVDAPI